MITLETSAFQSLCGGQVTLSTQLMIILGSNSRIPHHFKCVTERSDHARYVVSSLSDVVCFNPSYKGQLAFLAVKEVKGTLQKSVLQVTRGLTKTY